LFGAFYESLIASSSSEKVSTGRIGPIIGFYQGSFFLANNLSALDRTVMLFPEKENLNQQFLTFDVNTL
jgi:hypothetical protein